MTDSSVDRVHVVRVAAMTSHDELIKQVLLCLIGETDEEAMEFCKWRPAAEPVPVCETTLPSNFGANAYAMRAAALATDDERAIEVLLDLLGETEEQALSALSRSCWGEDLSADPAEQYELLRRSIASAITPYPPADTQLPD